MYKTSKINQFTSKYTIYIYGYMEGITMIIKLNEGLRASLFEFLKKGAEINIFINNKKGALY